MHLAEDSGIALWPHLLHSDFSSPVSFPLQLEPRHVLRSIMSLKPGITKNQFEFGNLYFSNSLTHVAYEATCHVFLNLNKNEAGPLGRWLGDSNDAVHKPAYRKPGGCASYH